MIKRLIIVSLLSIVLVGSALYYGYMQYTQPGAHNDMVTITVPPGTSAKKIAAILLEAELIQDSNVFNIITRIQTRKPALKAGEYIVPAHATMEDILVLLRSGKAVQHSVQLLEGETAPALLKILNEHPLLSGDPIVSLGEGEGLPDTYYITKNSSRQALLDRMVQAQEKVLDEAWQQRQKDLPLKNKKEALVLASIVEKETALASEKPKVAGVFMNRLRIDMPLQTDPTVIYAITKGKKPLGRPLWRKDIKETDNPYNTYLYKGLPPTPICFPGADSILAVLNPTKTDALYFVANGKGGHAFSKTLKEHNNSVRAWKKVLRDKKSNEQ